MSPLALILNIIWFIFGGGFIAALLWLLGGLLLFISIIGIPFGFAALRIANFTAFPFGRELVDAELVGEPTVVGTTLANILWILLAGIWLFIGHITAAIGFALTIIGLPFAWAHLKLALASFMPLGKRIVPSDTVIWVQVRKS
jgi:uncharacterized membrane protein YccF (DUF307 family)